MVVFVADDKIRSLETELVRADELMEVMRKKVPSYISEEDARILSPTAAAASQLLKSGMTLTQVSIEHFCVCTIISVASSFCDQARICKN